MGSSGTPGTNYGTKQAATAAKQAAGRAALAIGSGVLSTSRLIAKGVRAALADNSDKEAIRFLKFAELECSADQGGRLGSGGSGTPRRVPVLLLGLAGGFQVWRLDGANPAELVSRRDGPVKLLEVLPQPRCSGDEEACDALSADRPLLAVVPAVEPATTLSAAGRPTGAGAAQQVQREQQAHIVQLYSLQTHGYVRTLSFSSEVLGLQASGRLLVVALRGQLQAFDAATLHHTFSCLTYVPPPPPLRQLSRSGSGAAGRRQPAQPHQFVTEGLTSSTSSAGSEAGHYQQAASGAAGDGAGGQASAAALAPFALGPRWLAYAADTPVPAASGQAVAQRLSLARRDSSGSRASGAPEGEGGSGPGGLTRAAVAEAALQAASRGGQQLRAGLAAVGSASFRYLSHQYSSWRQGPLDQAQQQREADAAEADAAVAGTVVVRDAASRLVLAHFRAHTSPLAALQFSPCGRLLATASTAGHSINVFRLLPPPPLPGVAAGEEGGRGVGPGGAGSSAGQALWLYRLYRGVTPAAIRGIAFAPDASWVAVSSGRGTTHVFHTPTLAPGAGDAAAAQQQQPGAAAAETGVLGCPPKQAAAGRARKPGLLSGGMAGAATSAARNLYAGQPAEVEPIAAAFLPSGPGSPKAVAPAASSSGGSLYVVTSDGLLTRHLLAPPAAVAAAAGGTAAGAASVAAQGAGQEPALERQDSAAAAAAGAAAAVLEEADRWDVARHASWPEREELLPGLLDSSPAHSALSPADQQQLWVTQAECGALSAEGADGGGGAAGAAPLWRDPQFRCYEIQVQGLHVASAAPGAAAGADLDGTEGLAACLQAADLSGGSGGGDAPWLEDLPARPIQAPQ